MPVQHPIQPGDGDSRHGTANGYKNHKCRCDECQAGWAAYSRDWTAADPLRRKRHRVANQTEVVHPEPDEEEEPYVFQRESVKRIEMTGEVRIPADQENLLPWMTERLVVLDYNPEVKVVRDGEELVVRCALSLMPVEAIEPEWAAGVVREAIEWAKDDPRRLRTTTTRP